MTRTAISGPVLKIESLSVDYGKTRALETVNLSVNAGEILGLIGPNGAGKTTLIKALCGRIQVESGAFYIGGRLLNHGKDRQDLIGLVPQDIGLYGHMSARENLDAFAKIMGIKNRRERRAAVDVALDTVGLTHKAKARVNTFSGGMKRRINVAAAIMHGPRVLILDEPTAGADIPARDTVHRLARTIAKTGKAVLLVTHELEQAEALCDKILILGNGKPLACASPADILASCFGDTREIMVRFNTPPSPEIMAPLAEFNFQQGELETVWTALTRSSEITFLSAFIASLRGGSKMMREISIRRPGLTRLMHILEKTGELPTAQTRGVL